MSFLQLANYAIYHEYGTVDMVTIPENITVVATWIDELHASTALPTEKEILVHIEYKAVWATAGMNTVRKLTFWSRNFTSKF